MKILNPYVILAVFLSIDVIIIPLIIIAVVKKFPQGKRVKWIASVMAAVLIIEAASSALYINSHTFYDRYSNKYTDIEAIQYYDRNGKAFYIEESALNKDHIVSNDGTEVYIASKVYVDMDGYLVYDRDKKIQKTDKEYVYADSDGNEYYSASEVKWSKNGKLSINTDS